MDSTAYIGATMVPILVSQSPSPGRDGFSERARKRLLDHIVTVVVIFAFAVGVQTIGAYTACKNYVADWAVQATRNELGQQLGALSKQVSDEVLKAKTIETVASNAAKSQVNDLREQIEEWASKESKAVTRQQLDDISKDDFIEYLLRRESFSTRLEAEIAKRTADSTGFHELLKDKLTSNEPFLSKIKGASGIDGDPGKDGKDGADGRDGKDGADGRDGKDGADGRDGKDGTSVQAEDIAPGDSICVNGGTVLVIGGKRIPICNAVTVDSAGHI